MWRKKSIIIIDEEIHQQQQQHNNTFFTERIPYHSFPASVPNPSETSEEALVVTMIDSIIHLLFAVLAVYTQQDEDYFHVSRWLRGSVFYSLATVSILLSLKTIIFADFAKGSESEKANAETPYAVMSKIRRAK